MLSISFGCMGQGWQRISHVSCLNPSQEGVSESTFLDEFRIRYFCTTTVTMTDGLATWKGRFLVFFCCKSWQKCSKLKTMTFYRFPVCPIFVPNIFPIYFPIVTEDLEQVTQSCGSRWGSMTSVSQPRSSRGAKRFGRSM